MSSSSRVLKEFSLAPDTWCIIQPLVREDGDEAAPQSAEVGLAVAQTQAKSLLAQAEAEAHEILAEAERQAAAILAESRQKGLEQGFDQGYREALAKAQTENQATADRLQSLARSAEAEQHRLISELEAQLVELALVIARKIVGEELRIRPEVVTEIVARAIAEAHGSGHHVIHLHPMDAQLLQPYLPQAAIEAGGREWEIRADDTLSRGDCLIETAFGVVDACIDTQFRELAMLLKGPQADDAHIY